MVHDRLGIWTRWAGDLLAHSPALGDLVVDLLGRSRAWSFLLHGNPRHPRRSLGQPRIWDGVLITLARGRGGRCHSCLLRGDSCHSIVYRLLYPI